MVLEEDIAFRAFSEGRPVLILAVGHQCTPLLCSAFILHDLAAIQVMFHFRAITTIRAGSTYPVRLHICRQAGWDYRIWHRLDQVVQRAHGAIPPDTR